MRLIDADALMTWFDEHYDDEIVTVGYVTGLIKDEPTIVPEIVRCKDCKYHKKDEYGRWYCIGLGYQVGDEDGSGFCSDAERRTDV